MMRTTYFQDQVGWNFPHATKQKYRHFEVSRVSQKILLRSDCPIQASSLVFLDIETTGIRPDRGAQITEIALIDRGGIRLHWKEEKSKLKDDALAAVLVSLFDHLSAGVVVGHNLSFDFRFLAYEADRLGYVGPRVRYIDTLGLAQAIILDAENYQLGTLLKRFSIMPKGALHTALTDAIATQNLFWKLVEVGGLRTLAEAGMKPLHWTTF